jgi:hypothetical protein
MHLKGMGGEFDFRFKREGLETAKKHASNLPSGADHSRARNFNLLACASTGLIGDGLERLEFGYENQEFDQDASDAASR